MSKDAEPPFANDLKAIAQDIAFDHIDFDTAIAQKIGISESSNFSRSHIDLSIEDLQEFVREKRDEYGREGLTSVTNYVEGWLRHKPNIVRTHVRAGTLAYMIAVEHDFFAEEEISELEQRFLLDYAIQQIIEDLQKTAARVDMRFKYGLSNFQLAPEGPNIQEFLTIQNKLRERVSPPNPTERK